MSETEPDQAGPRTFGDARRRLDEILDELERDTGDVDRLAARIREAGELIRFCRERLAAARQEVRQVVADLAAEEKAADGSPDPGPAAGEAPDRPSEDWPADPEEGLPF